MMHLDRILANGYIPTDQDILHARVRTIGITKEIFEADGVEYHVVDPGGSRIERKKWVYAFSNVDAVLFQAPIGSYDEPLAEDHSTVSEWISTP